ncbi:glycosyltransferase family A protein [Photobacterium damselae]|uniref:glycosyltransferase family A protein n=1 Tax=Photobacterium damselae TaxID=38293 RepID=UPI004067C423
MATLTIIIPFYNISKRVIPCLESIKATCNDSSGISVIFINDGSTDDSCEIIDCFLKENNINYNIITKSNGGVSSARNLGIINSKSDYVLFLDSDDFIFDDAISFFISKAEQYFGSHIIAQYKSIVSEVDKSLSINDSKESELICRNNEFFERYISGDLISEVSVCSVFFYLDTLKKNKILFNEEMTHGEDQLFLLDVLKNSNFKYYNKIILGYVKDTSNSAMGRFSYSRLSIIELYMSFINMTNNDETKVKIYQRVQFEILILVKLALKNLGMKSAWSFFKLEIDKRIKDVCECKPFNNEYYILSKYPFLYMIIYKVYRWLKK